MGTPAAPHTRGRMRKLAREIMQRHWNPDGGYTCPNPVAYPAQWLWDSCFHAIIWVALGDPERARAELLALLRSQSATGLVPHLVRRGAARGVLEWWPAELPSPITHPPMYGHALRVMAEAGLRDSELEDRARAGLQFLLRERRRSWCDGLVVVLHPSEAGGPSPRFDTPDGGARPHAWPEYRVWLLSQLRTDSSGAAIASASFEVASAGFNAILAWNALELAALAGDTGLERAALEICDALEVSWSEERGLWLDRSLGGRFAADVRSLDGLLPALLPASGGRLPRVLATVSDPDGLRGPWGVRGVDRREACFEPDGYWRGASWPQLNYLVWQAVTQGGMAGVSRELADTVFAAALQSGFAEYYDADSGRGLGAQPQAWACLPVAMHGMRPRALRN